MGYFIWFSSAQHCNFHHSTNAPLQLLLQFLLPTTAICRLEQMHTTNICSCKCLLLCYTEISCFFFFMCCSCTWHQNNRNGNVTCVVWFVSWLRTCDLWLLCCFIPWPLLLRCSVARVYLPVCCRFRICCFNGSQSDTHEWFTMYFQHFFYIHTNGKM